ncbi:MAG TPA: DUF4345 domain-containing protein [Candidatus Binatia bacterium]
MDRARLFLAVNALLWLPYGLYLLARPDALAEIAGVVGATPTGRTELRAMYGGLQAAIGVLALLATLRHDLRRTALVTLAFLTGGLFTGRVSAVVVGGGISAYTVGALLLEVTLAGLSTALLRQTPRS